MLSNTNRLIEIIDKFSSTSICVQGDIMLDVYHQGDVSRISPEAPVPVVLTKGREYRLGGAANVALNLAHLGADVRLIGTVGKDDYATVVRENLETNKIKTDWLIESPERSTCVKTRIIANKQQMLRIDEEQTHDSSGPELNLSLHYLEKSLADCGGIILSDYGKGLFHKESLQSVRNILDKYEGICSLDPKKKNYDYYQSFTTMTPNHHEAAEDAGLACDSDSEVQSVAHALLKKHQLEHILITRGAKGMSLYDHSELKHIPTFAREVFDVSGAGDTVISSFTLAQVCGASPFEAAQIANIAAGVVVGKFGTASLSVSELSEAINKA